MTTLSNRPVRLMLVEFNELFARHLCRHSQFGINVIHLLALWGVWYAVYGLLVWLAGAPWVLAFPVAVYLLAIVPNVPVRVFAASAAFLGTIVAALIWLPQPPFWAYLIAIPVLYKLQSWSHRLYTVKTDMTEFNRKYTKGRTLFVVLLVYEVPIALNYVLFGRQTAPVVLAPMDHASAAARVA